ncbi:MAG: carbohydrate-binding protein, partial [Bacilli bacterium]
ADTTYSYTVVAVDKANNRSEKSNTLTLKTKKEEIVEGTWKKDATYLAGDTVTYNGVTYTAKWWSKGDEPGKSDVWSAKNVTSTEWQASKAYVANEVVIFEGKTYTAKWWTRGDKPGTSDVWKVVK